MYYEVLGRRFSWGFGDEDEEEKALDYAIEQAMKLKRYVWVRLCSDADPIGWNRFVASPEGGCQGG